MNNLSELLIVYLSLFIFSKMIGYKFAFKVKWYDLINQSVINYFFEIIFKKSVVPLLKTFFLKYSNE